jgi:hypothetical protein
MPRFYIGMHPPMGTGSYGPDGYGGLSETIQDSVTSSVGSCGQRFPSPREAPTFGSLYRGERAVQVAVKRHPARAAVSG